MAYLLVANIPSDFHSSHLRSYFSEFIEMGKFSCFHFRHRPQEELVQSNSLEISQQLDKKKRPLCCLVQLKDLAEALKFATRYHGKNWVDRDDNDLPSKCVIIRLTLDSLDTDKKVELLNFSRRDLKLSLHPETVLKSIEMKPPSLMPQGNVGTPTKYFLDLIKTCQLPSSLIAKLDLKFPKTRVRKYGSVPFEYGTGTLVSCDDEDSAETQKQFSRRAESQQTEDRLSEESEEEEWERHEALHDDVTEQERTKERLYEEEEEVVWEKGGPGIVWYTDAQLWREAEGDFDEQTADDWDVDYSAYHEEGAGDKDARDLLEMRRSEMWRQGVKVDELRPTSSGTSRNKQKHKIAGVGTFEQHTRGVGRRLLERFGWREGEGLGRSQKGIVQPVESDGQLPKEKKGLGYRGETLNRFAVPKRPRRSSPHDVIISTVYDDPTVNDPEEPLLERNPKTYLKYR